MKDLELATLIDRKIANGIGGLDGELSITRQDSLDRYYGEMYGYEIDGESSVVTRDLMETIEWAMPSIMRSFCTGRQVVSFKPTSGQDELAAEQETDAVWEIYDQNKGFYVTHTVIKSALLNPASYVKVSFEESEEVVTEEYENLSEIELTLVLESDDIKITGQEANISDDGQATYDIEIEYIKKSGECIIEPLPEEEVIISKTHNRLSLEKSSFTCHRRERTYSDLMEEGVSQEILDRAGGSAFGSHSDEAFNRERYSDESYRGDDAMDKTMEVLWVEECNMYVDFNDDGIAERRRVTKIGTEIIENEPCTSADIVAFSSILMPHKHLNVCLSDLVKDLQEIRTTIMRQLLNNMYKVNNPRTIITDDVNMDDILGNESNGFIRTTDIDGIRTEPTNPIIGQVIPALEVLNNEKESRTGISKSSKGLDADVLSNSTMGAYRDAIAQANERVELIIRVLAETGFKDLFCKIHEVLQRHGAVQEMKVKGEWIPVNPREWKERKHMTAHVGLGHNNRQEKLGAAMAITQHQKELIGSPLIEPQNLYAGAELIAEAAGETVDKYFTNPSTAQPKQEQPQSDPNIMMIEATKQIEQLKESGKDKDRELKDKEAQWKRYVDQQKLNLEAAKEGREITKLELDNQVELPGGIGE